MTVGLAIWMGSWALLAAAVLAMVAVSNESFVYRIGPAMLVGALITKIVERTLWIIGEPLTVSQVPMKAYSLAFIVIAAALTVGGLSGLLMSRRDANEMDYHSEGHDIGSRASRRDNWPRGRLR